MRVAVAGGTGLVGRLVVPALQERGHEPVVLSRARGADLVTGAGLDLALAGCEAVVDVSSTPTTSGRRAEAFFGAATANLLAYGERAGVRHVLALSVVGSDRVPLGHYLGKRRQEALLAAGPLPWTVLRATQFHEFAGQLLDRAPGPVAPVPRMLCRPVAAREVAALLAELVEAPAAGLAEQLAGPREESLVEMARRLLAVRGSRRLVLPVRVPGAAGRGMASGDLLPVGPSRQGTETYEQFLARTAA